VLSASAVLVPNATSIEFDTSFLVGPLTSANLIYSTSSSCFSRNFICSIVEPKPRLTPLVQ